MKTKLLLAVFGMLFSLAVWQPTKASTIVCAPSGGQVYLPFVEASMANNPQETIEKLLTKQKDFAYDGRIVEIFSEDVSVKLVGSPTIERNIAIPSHIAHDELAKGMAVRLGMHQGRRILLAIFPQFDQELNYAGKGSIIPDPPKLTVVATKDGWLVTWPPVPGAERYRVYRNDTADETSPDDLGYTTDTSMLVPYESPYIYFAAKSVSGLNESEVSGWVTDSDPPPVPDTFNPGNYIDGHQLSIQGSDVSLLDASFKCWEIEIADDDSGTNNTSLGNFYPQDLPYIVPFGSGTVKYYRISSIDWAGNQSDWTDWDDAWAIAGTIKDLFDGYGGDSISSLESLYWLKMLNMEEPIVTGTPTAEAWWTYDDDLSHESLIEGALGIKAPMRNGTGDIDFAYRWYYVGPPPSGEFLDISQEERFTDDDFVLLVMYIDPSTYAELTTGHYIDLWDNDSDIARIDLDSLQSGMNYLKFKRSDIDTNPFDIDPPPTFDWDEVTFVRIYLYLDGWDVGYYVTVDDFRIVKADPDDATDYNDTGLSWDKAAHTGTDFGEWHIYAGNRTGEPDKPYSYGQIKTAGSPSVWYMSHKPLSTTEILSGTVQSGIYLKDDDGKAGLAFYVKDVTADSWDMFVLEADSSGDTITLAKYVAGSRTQIAQASFTFAPDEILWLGADFKDYDADGGRIKVYASLDEGNLIQASNLILSEQDDEWVGDAGGSVGLLSYQANVRFINFVAGSPAHAETADVARALDGPLLGALILPEGPELTIDTGEITVGNFSRYAVDTEGDAASDDVDTINGGVDGQVCRFKAADSARTVVWKDGTGNLSLNGDFSEDDAADRIVLEKDGATWYEWYRSSNA